MRMQPAGQLAAALLLATATSSFALGAAKYVAATASAGSVPIVRGGRAATIVVHAADWPGVVRAAHDLQADVQRVSGVAAPFATSASGVAGPAIIAGTVGRSPLIDSLVRAGKIDVAGIRGKWEAFFLQTIANPLPGIDSAVVIAGSDKRGTIYGLYDLSEQMGVSPWYWWADVTPEHRDALFVRAGKYQQGEPSVKYRGIFFNDEKPDLDFWVRAKFGEHPTPGGGAGTVASFNHEFYARVFEVLLRLKANYLWPAMWNNAFAEDDPDNPRLADEYGIVMGTSHQEPMLRAQKEWDWHLRPTLGLWNYATHPDEMNAFWREGVRARKNYEAIYTIGLRGENDTAMVQGAQQSMALLETIVAAQRKMLAEEVNPDVTKVPQLWCLYKEVQGYYESGLRVPDDVTLLWAEDNWGNIRRLPTAEERKRPGGAGIYYHFDYHGGPRSYQWINTSPLPKIQEQMSLAKAYGADRIWIVNVGHFKGYELPTEYFLSLAWDTTRWTPENVGDFTRAYAAREFGDAHADAIADVLATYTMFNGRRKPELIDASTYSVVNFQEADRVVAGYNAVVAKAQAIFDALPASKRDAFYELALFPAKASANLNEMYVAAAKNALYASQGRTSASRWAARTRELFQADADLMTHFNKTFAGGKWDHFMDQSHIGYTTWADPPANTMAAIRLTDVTPKPGAALAMSVEGWPFAWPAVEGPSASPMMASLPRFDAIGQQRHYIELFNRGDAPASFTITAAEPWIQVSQSRGQVTDDTKIWVTVDWTRVPNGAAVGTVDVEGAGASVTVRVETVKPADVTRESLRGSAEDAGYVAVEAEHFSASTAAGANRWVRLDRYGHTLSGMRASGPVDIAGLTPGPAAPRLDYRMYLVTPGAITTTLTLGPTLNFAPGRPVRIAVAFDDDAPQVLTVVPAGYSASNGNRDWEESVRNNARRVTASSTLAAAGYHTLKVWMVDPAVVVERIVVATPAAGHLASYLGPPETTRK